MELDKGPSFEARIRDIVSRFDNRNIFDKEGKIFGEPNKNPQTLHKYISVERKNFMPEEDEIGIVFSDNTPIEMEVVAERLQSNRCYLLMAECKFRPNAFVGKNDIILLSKKRNFLQKRYEKMANLQGLNKPIIEECWFISIGGFMDEAIKEAKRNDIKIIDKNGINLIFKEFKEFQIR